MSGNNWNDDGPVEANKILNDPDRIKVRKPTNSTIKRIWKHFQKYTGSTSIHGLQYVGGDDRTLFERLWWCFIFLGSILLCAYYIYSSWYKWNTSPVIVSFAETMTPIWQIPFPAITICSETKVKRSFFNVTRATDEYYEKKISDEDLDLYRKSLLLCLFDDDTHDYNSTSNVTDKSTIDYLMEAQPDIGIMFNECYITSKPINCSRFFSSVLTHDGFCYTFNLLNPNEIFTDVVANREYFQNFHDSKSIWSLENGYPKNSNVKVYPMRGIGTGKRGNFMVLLGDVNDDTDYECQGVEEGFKIYFHQPGEIPTLSSQHFRIGHNLDVLVAIEPNIMTTAEALRSYSPKDRQCYFPNERKLRYYKVYTQNNCESECTANYTLHICKCLPFFMPRDNSTPICGTRSMKCYEDAFDSMIKVEIQSQINEDTEGINDYTHAFCDCLPSCTNLKYDADVSQVSLDLRKFKDIINFTDDGISHSFLTVNFRNNKVLTSTRSELYSVADFLANCGGLLGLFMGFSILSLAEIFYFCSIRIYCSKMKKRAMKPPEMSL